jgi:hypothetical protein
LPTKRDVAWVAQSLSKMRQVVESDKGIFACETLALASSDDSPYVDIGRSTGLKEDNPPRSSCENRARHCRN